METLKQHVAKAIFVAADDATNYWPTPEHPECQKMADAVIRVMRECGTELLPMLVAGKKALFSISEDPTLEAACDCWCAMIDAGN